MPLSRAAFPGAALRGSRIPGGNGLGAESGRSCLAWPGRGAGARQEREIGREGGEKGGPSSSPPGGAAAPRRYLPRGHGHGPPGEPPRLEAGMGVPSPAAEKGWGSRARRSPPPGRRRPVPLSSPAGRKVSAALTRPSDPRSCSQK